MPVPTESEAKHFLIERIGARAAMEGRPLSRYEQRVLLSSELTPLRTQHTGRSPEPDEAAEAFEYRMAELLRHAYELDCASEPSCGQPYWEAIALLSRGDHYLNWIAELAGLSRPLPAWLRAIKQAVLVVLLVVPALAALAIAGAGLWAAQGQASRSRAEAVGMSAVALVFAGFAAFLLALWLREQRGSGRAAEQGVGADEPQL